MNERIEKLAQRVDLLGEFMPTKKPGRYVGYITEEQILEFAELIVQECIDTVSDCSVEYCTRPQIVSEIKQHFGVE